MTADTPNTLAAKIDEAEAAAHEALQALIEDYEALKIKAAELRDQCKRLSALSDDASKIESAIRTALDGKISKARDPDRQNGEHVDEELKERVKAAKAGEAVA